MKFLTASSFVFYALLLASCAGSATTSTEPSAAKSNSAGTEVSTDPDFGPKCIQRIRAGLSDPNAAEIVLDGGGSELLASVTITDPESGQKAHQNYVCKRDAERAITARLISE